MKMEEIFPLSDGPASQSLTQTLDHLLERYLNLLHDYQTLQQQLSQRLSSSYLSLAQANFQSPNCTRYGQDFYDGRMQASTLISVTTTTSLSTFNFSLFAPGRLSRPQSSSSREDTSSVDTTTEPSAESSYAISSHPSAPPSVPLSEAPVEISSSPSTKPSAEPSLEPSSVNSSEPTLQAFSHAKFSERPLPGLATAKTTISSPPIRDPLNWFGILVPSALRQAQRNFKSVVEETVSQIAQVVGEMRAMELQVRRVRKKLLQAERRAAKDS